MLSDNKEFVVAVEKLKKLRARFDQRQVLKHEFELLVRFEEETYDLWGLYQQAVVGNINVPKLDYFDPAENSWMWGWIKGNMKWHAWNRCKGMTRQEATLAYIEGVRSLEERLPNLIEDWKDDQDPRIPDRNRYVPEEEREEVARITREAKAARRERDALKRAEEEAMGMWDE
ncbi:acyl CoA binding protein [Ancylostoma ceylanicum]|uniref:Acyl CoA binding protein n=2 Tax=Ancylostoma ceylanicum TaxID=53326 RepID=A0A0D6MAT2_9BILA|nr:acyl CoA binding protein [Ancylostoma ceylanicum]EYC08488.1 hypothetical protein Y032_0065g3578 [Ancylostoma ceylanicum]